MLTVRSFAPHFMLGSLSVGTETMVLNQIIVFPLVLFYPLGRLYRHFRPAKKKIIPSYGYEAQFAARWYRKGDLNS